MRCEKPTRPTINMSTLFSIDEDELDVDLDDEEFLLTACGIVTTNSSSSPCITGTTAVSSTSTCTDSLRPVSFTSQVRQPTAQYGTSLLRRPLGSIGNIAVHERGLQQSPYSSSSSSRQSPDLQPPLKKIAIDSLSNNSRTCIPSHEQTVERHSAHLSSSRQINGGLKCQTLEPTKNRFSVDDNNHGNSSMLQGLHNASSVDSPCASGKSSFRVEFEAPVTLDVPSCFVAPTAKDSCVNSSISKSQDSTRTSKRCSISATSMNSDMPSKSNVQSPFAVGQSSPCNSGSSIGKRNLLSPVQQRLCPSTSNSCTPVSKCTEVTPTRSSRMRKFPGPAGMLPKLSPGQNLDETMASPTVSLHKTSPVTQDRVTISQPSTEDEDFDRDPWICMYKEFKQNAPVMLRYSIVKVLTEAAAQRLQYGKVPCMCVLVKTFSPTEAEASIFLKDPTGEIHGTLHRKVLEEYQQELGPGAGLILKQVSVFSPSPRKHYLNITPGNILHIYPPNPSYIISSQPLASQVSQAVKHKSQERIVIEDITEWNLELSREDEPSSEAVQTGPVTDHTEGNFQDLLEGLEEDEQFDETLLAM